MAPTKASRLAKRAGFDAKAPRPKPDFEDLSNNIENAGLDDPRPNLLTPADANVGDTLEGEREAVGDGPIRREETRRGGNRERETVEVWRWRRRARDARVAENVKKSLEAAVKGEDLTDPGRSRGKIGEVGERVEQGERRRAVESCKNRSQTTERVGQRGVSQNIRGDDTAE